MQRLPIDIGIIHFIGIGGIGMSGIAEILHNLGYKVQGSDISENQNVNRLQRMGVKVFVGQASKNLRGVSIAVVSTAIQAGNVELSFAREKQIPYSSSFRDAGRTYEIKVVDSVCRNSWKDDHHFTGCLRSG